jgi:hypothetical protein
MYAISDLTNISGVEAIDAMRKLDISAAVALRPRVCRLTLHDCDDSITNAAVAGADLQFSWEFSKTGTTLFTGTIETVRYPEIETVELVGFDSFRKLQNEKLTITQVNQTPAEMLRTLVGQQLGLPVDGIEDYPDLLDKLPMHRMTVVDAIKYIHQRMRLSHDCYFDEDNVFVWQARNYDQEPVYNFQVGYDADDFSLEKKSFTTMAVPLRLSQVVTVLDRHETLHTLFVTGLHYHNADNWSRTDVFFEKAPEENE